MVLTAYKSPIDWRKKKYFPTKTSPTLRYNLQKGLLTILSSHGYDPLKFWSCKPGNGCIKRIRCSSLEGLVIDMSSPTFCSTYIASPEDTRLKLGCSMPILTIVMEYLNEPFGFEFQLKDGENMKRRYRASTCKTKNKSFSPLFCHVPLKLSVGWNKIEVDLKLLTKLTYNSDYVEILGIQIYASCRLRRVYFSDRKYREDELPEEYLLKEPRPPYQVNVKTCNITGHPYHPLRLCI